jgi:hypothetical protein
MSCIRVVAFMIVSLSHSLRGFAALQAFHEALTRGNNVRCLPGAWCGSFGRHGKCQFASSQSRMAPTQRTGAHGAQMPPPPGVVRASLCSRRYRAGGGGSASCRYQPLAPPTPLFGGYVRAPSVALRKIARRPPCFAGGRWTFGRRAPVRSSGAGSGPAPLAFSLRPALAPARRQPPARGLVAVADRRSTIRF